MRMLVDRWLGLVSALLLTVALGLGCSVQQDPDRNTGGDGTRLDAIEIPLNRTVIDNVSYVDGDMHDWKYFRVPVQGLVSVLIAFDNPQAKGVVIVRDATGMQVARMEHRAEPRLQQTFRADPGIYYLEIYVNVEHSDYTLEVNFEQAI